MALTTACSRYESNIFGESAAERLHKSEKACRTALTEAPNGWEMLYFPEPDAAGYAYLCEFNEDGSVVFAAKNPVGTSNIYKEETSLWTTDGTQGCVLSFSTYNTIFSVFANPGDDGVGYNGDYEFVVLKTTPDQILMKGKKHGAYITMNRLAAEQDWADYFATIDRFNDDVFRGNDGIVMTYADGDTIYDMTYKTGTFSYTDTAGVEYTKGFILSPTGMHFYSGCPLAGTENLAQNFVMNEEKTKIYSIDNPEVFFASKFSATEFFAYKFEKYNRWIYTEDGTDAETVAAVNEIKALAAANGATITRFAYDFYYRILRDRKIKTYCFYVSYLAEGKLFEGRIMCTFNDNEGVMTLAASSADANLTPLLLRIDPDKTVAQKKITDIFMGSFTAESYTGTTLNMVQLLLHSTENSNKFIHVIADITK